jgi:hypothetical protein
MEIALTKTDTLILSVADETVELCVTRLRYAQIYRLLQSDATCQHQKMQRRRRPCLSPGVHLVIMIA